MKPDFYAARSAIPDEPARTVEPIGWNGTDGATATGNPPRFPATVDPWDSSRSRMPYPASMPSPDVQSGGGPGNVDVHVRALRHVEKVAHDASIIVAAGDLSRLADLKRAIVRRKAMREEMGTGVVEYDADELRILAMGDDETEVTA